MQAARHVYDNFGSTVARALFNAVQTVPHIKKTFIYKFPEGGLKSRFASLPRSKNSGQMGHNCFRPSHVHGPEAKVAIYPNAGTLDFEE
jgi:hypothetical protein